MWDSIDKNDMEQHKFNRCSTVGMKPLWCKIWGWICAIFVLLMMTKINVELFGVCKKIKSVSCKQDKQIAGKTICRMFRDHRTSGHTACVDCPTGQEILGTKTVKNIEYSAHSTKHPPVPEKMFAKCVIFTWTSECSVCSTRDPLPRSREI